MKAAQFLDRANILHVGRIRVVYCRAVCDRGEFLKSRSFDKFPAAPFIPRTTGVDLSMVTTLWR
jgi:hypothetical protein